jgi:hypothetical protein
MDVTIKDIVGVFCLSLFALPVAYMMIHDAVLRFIDEWNESKPVKIKNKNEAKPASTKNIYNVECNEDITFRIEAFKELKKQGLIDDKTFYQHYDNLNNLWFKNKSE